MKRLRLLSYNIHIGSRPQSYGHYLTRAWRHALPGAGMHGTLDEIAEVMRDYDFVAIQEADAGSLRTRFTNQVEYLARRGGFKHLGFAVTRDFAPMARHALGYLSRHRPAIQVEHRLPGRIPGRRVLEVELGPDAGGVRLLIAHLSLGRADRERQLDFLARRIAAGRTVVLGDLNTEPAALHAHGALTRGGIWVPRTMPATFPSWRPSRSIDHILTTPDLALHKLESLPHRLSDHLPIRAEVTLAGAN